MPDHAVLTCAERVGRSASAIPAAWCMTLMAARRRRRVETLRARWHVSGEVGGDSARCRRERAQAFDAAPVGEALEVGLVGPPSVIGPGGADVASHRLGEAIGNDIRRGGELQLAETLRAL